MLKANFLKALALSLAFVIPSAAVAGGCVEEVDGVITFNNNGNISVHSISANFTADIQPRDLTNSSGNRLGNFAAVLQQNRANVYKFGPLDQRDAYFTTLARRSELSTGRYFSYCGENPRYSKELKEYILKARMPGWVWVIRFIHPDGKPAFFMTLVG